MDKTEVLPMGKLTNVENLDAHTKHNLDETFPGCSTLGQGTPIRVLGVWIGSQDKATHRWTRITKHIQTLIHQWNRIGASQLNRVLLAKALLLSQCYYLLDGNRIPTKYLHKISNMVNRFIRGPFSNAPYSILSAPLKEGGLNSPSLVQRKQAYDLKFIGDLISGPQDTLWKEWTCLGLRRATTLQSKVHGTIYFDPLIQIARTTASHLEPRLAQAIKTAWEFRYQVVCSMPSEAARLSAPAYRHPAFPINETSMMLLPYTLGIKTVQDLWHPPAKYTERLLRKDASHLKSNEACEEMKTLLRHSQWLPPNETRRFLITKGTKDPKPSRKGTRGRKRKILNYTYARQMERASQKVRTAKYKARLQISVTVTEDTQGQVDAPEDDAPEDVDNDSSYPKHKSIKIWPNMKSTLGCARILSSNWSQLTNLWHITDSENYSKNRFAPTPMRKKTLFPPDRRHRYNRIINVWTDGSAEHNGQDWCTAGAAWVTDTSHSESIKLADMPCSNNIAELIALISALENWRHQDVHIHTDSTWVLSLLKGGLLARERDGWTGHQYYDVTTEYPHTLATLHKYNCTCYAATKATLKRLGLKHTMVTP